MYRSSFYVIVVNYRVAITLLGNIRSEVPEDYNTRKPLISTIKGNVLSIKLS